MMSFLVGGVRVVKFGGSLMVVSFICYGGDLENIAKENGVVIMSLYIYMIWNFLKLDFFILFELK